MRLSHFLILVGGLALYLYVGMEPMNDLGMQTHNYSQPKSDVFFLNEPYRDETVLELINLNGGRIHLSAELQAKISSIILCFLAGWALGRLLMQFKGIILSFIGLFILFNFFLLQTEVVIPIFNFSVLGKIFPLLKACITKMGFISFMSLLAGAWFGGRRFQRTKPQVQSNS